MSTNNEIGEIFLKRFIQELILFSKLSPGINEENIANINRSRKSTNGKDIIPMFPEFKKSVLATQVKTPNFINTNQAQLIKKFSQRERFQPSRKVETIQQPKNSSQSDTSEISVIEKLNFLIRDPAITEIECSGSDQPILVKKAGVIQRTKVALSIEEVYELIAEFSQKTKIPVVEGTFKAALDNLVLTAILSETLGPRFILHKKIPFQKLLPQ